MSNFLKRLKIITLLTFFLIYCGNVYAITFNFKNADLRDVIEGYALMIGKSFIIDSRVTGKVNVISSEEISIDQAEEIKQSFGQMRTLEPSMNTQISQKN